jgi:hypothetical protein
MCEAQEQLIAPKRVSRKTISVSGAYLTFFYKNSQPPYFSNILESEKLRFSIFQTFKNCQVSPKNQWLFDGLKCVCGQMGYVSEKWVFGVF